MADEQQQSDEATFTGLTRERTTPRSVRRAETIASVSITAGGIGTILAVTLIFVFLLVVVFPLFTDAEVRSLDPIALEGRNAQDVVIKAGVDDAQFMAWTLTSDGRLRIRRLRDGSVLDDRDLFAGRRPACWSFSPGGSDCAFGFDDGTVVAGRIRFVVAYLEGDDVPETAKDLRIGGSTPFRDGIVSVTPEKQYRFDRLEVTMREPDQVADSAIELIDYAFPSSGRAFAYLTASNRLAIRQYFERHDMMLDKKVEDAFDKPIVYEPDVGRGPPSYLKLDGQATMAFLIWKDGLARRFDCRETVLARGGDLEQVEEIQLLGGAPERHVDAIQHLVGKTTMVVADDRGILHCWFPTRPGDAYARDGIEMARSHVLGSEGPRVTTLTNSHRGRLLASGHEDGTARVFQVTTEQLLVEVQAEREERIRGLALAPKEDGLVVWTAAGLQRWALDLAHPEATLASLFTPVWYEGQSEPKHTWQSEGGSDDFEPKYGMWPLVFGTLKATLYSMLIAVPIALLAALYTSEFLSPRWRSPIKSVIEMMASLPSVVLGFLAAIVLAPFVDSVLITVLAMFLALPFTVTLGARLWQLLPSRLAIRWGGMPRFVTICLMLPLSLQVASWIAPLLEHVCFAGDIDAWLNQGAGSNAGGWTFILIPVGLVVTAFVVARFAGPWLRRVSAQWSRLRCAVVDLVRFAVVIAAGIGLAWVAGQALGGGVDPREVVVGQYQKRNAMIVGFVMGFAIVPIIYTLAEDALSSVPQQLREGSLGCGATPWQTGMRIVVPAAMSGLFGAMMVGLGRAVGETMIVLMAAGNTAILDLNVFNGFRTLSANIATELPEAVKGSTHYRVLFLAGFVLFAMTFVINTVAELVRRHFRKRFADL